MPQSWRCEVTWRPGETGLWASGLVGGVPATCSSEGLKWKRNGNMFAVVAARIGKV